jgi:stage IV sporulation protein B
MSSTTVTASACCYETEATSVSGSEDDIEIGSRFADLIFGKGDKGACNREVKETYLCPGGDAFGVKILDGRVSVARVITELKEGHLEVDDTIIAINGATISSIEDVKTATSTFSGEPLCFSIIRNGKRITEYLKPESNGSDYHLGVILTDLTSGIGTVTYYDPASGEFGGLGHGILSKDGKNAVKLTRGTATGVILGGIKKGKDGDPGELRGVLTDRSIGTIYANTECGVFGNLTEYNATASPILCADRSEVKCGEATVISSVKNGNKSEFSITISDIDLSSTGSKSFRISVTDETLIALTGGIVRGMSGSPIIQNGKLVGAVTHVMVADPTEGYGIFIENMLNASVSTRNELPAA